MAVTSTITTLELLVQPYRLADIDRANKFYALLTTYPHLEWIEPNLAISDQAARTSGRAQPANLGRDSSCHSSRE
jgi:hypothetical protein